jgi:hypothetical protein
MTNIIEKKPWIINIIGGPGIGKTTISALLFAKLKINGHITEYVQEYAKRLVWTKDYDKLNNQYYVIKKQFQLLKDINDTHINFIITDGPILHGLYYNKYNLDNTSNVEKTEEYIMECYEKFNNINIVLQRIKRENQNYEQEGRIQTEEEAKVIDNELKNILKSKNIKYNIFNADDNAVEKIYNYIMDYIKFE